MEENKAKICKSILPALQQTRAGAGIVDIVYFTNVNAEYAEVRFVNHSTMRVCITADSGIAILKDIVDALI